MLFKIFVLSISQGSYMFVVSLSPINIHLHTWHAGTARRPALALPYIARQILNFLEMSFGGFVVYPYRVFTFSDD